MVCMLPGPQAPGQGAHRGEPQRATGWAGASVGSGGIGGAAAPHGTPDRMAADRSDTLLTAGCRVAGLMRRNAGKVNLCKSVV